MGWEVLVGTEFGNPSIEIPNGATANLQRASIDSVVYCIPFQTSELALKKRISRRVGDFHGPPPLCYLPILKDEVV